MREIVLAGGCFWGLEKYFEQFSFLKTQTGYANGDCANPSYEMVCNGSGHAEALYIQYPDDVSLAQILDLFFKVIDPTALNRQGNDVGINYRTGIYCLNKEQYRIAEAMVKDLQERYRKPVVTEVEMLKNYTPAEDYHQKYLDAHPFGYCHIPRYKMSGVSFPTIDQVIQAYPSLADLEQKEDD